MGLTMASCTAYSTMNGVIMPGVSAGSKQVGASETCTPHTTWPSGAASPRAGAPARTRKAAPERHLDRHACHLGGHGLQVRLVVGDEAHNLALGVRDHAIVAVDPGRG